MAVFFKVFFHFQGRHAAGAGRGNGLAVPAILHVSAGKNPGTRVKTWSVVRMYPSSSRSSSPRNILALGIVANAQEHGAYRQGRLFMVERIPQAQAAHFLLLHAQHLFDRRVGQELDLLVAPWRDRA